MTDVITLPRQRVLDALIQADIADCELREKYSGRGMYGDTCFGLICGLNQLVLFVHALATQAAEDGCDTDDTEWLQEVCSDSMGRDEIYYFPHAQVEPSADGSCDDDTEDDED